MASLTFMGFTMPDADYCLVPVGRYGHFAAVDTADWESVRWRTWSLQRTPGGNLYAFTSMYKGCVTMHRFIVGCDDPALVVDHKNGCGLLNRRYNLREATRRQNAINRGGAHNSVSGVVGVRKLKLSNLWMMTCGDDEPQYFLTMEEAIEARFKAAAAKYGEFARVQA